MALQKQNQFYQIKFHFDKFVNYSFKCLLGESDEVESEKHVIFVVGESYALTYNTENDFRSYLAPNPKRPKEIIEIFKNGDFMCLSGKFYEENKSKKANRSEYFYFKKDFNLFNEILSLQHKQGNENVKIFLEKEKLPSA